MNAKSNRTWYMTYLACTYLMLRMAVSKAFFSRGVNARLSHTSQPCSHSCLMLPTGFRIRSTPLTFRFGLCLLLLTLIDPPATRMGSTLLGCSPHIHCHMTRALRAFRQQCHILALRAVACCRYRCRHRCLKCRQLQA